MRQPTSLYNLLYEAASSRSTDCLRKRNEMKASVRLITCRLQLCPIQPWKLAAFNSENIAIFKCTRLARPAHLSAPCNFSRLLLSSPSSKQEETERFFVCWRRKGVQSVLQITAMIDKCIMSYVLKVRGALFTFSVLFSLL